LWPMPLVLLFNTQAMHIKSFYTQQHCYVSLKTLHPGGIRTRVFLFLRQRRHAARSSRAKFTDKNLSTNFNPKIADKLLNEKL
jgi:hypothetical protein